MENKLCRLTRDYLCRLSPVTRSGTNFTAWPKTSSIARCATGTGSTHLLFDSVGNASAIYLHAPHAHCTLFSSSVTVGRAPKQQHMVRQFIPVQHGTSAFARPSPARDLLRHSARDWPRRYPGTSCFAWPRSLPPPGLGLCHPVHCTGPLRPPGHGPAMPPGSGIAPPSSPRKPRCLVLYQPLRLAGDQLCRPARECSTVQSEIASDSGPEDVSGLRIICTYLINVLAHVNGNLHDDDSDREDSDWYLVRGTSRTYHIPAWKHNIPLCLWPIRLGYLTPAAALRY